MVLKYLRFFAWVMSRTLIENGVVDIYWFIINSFKDLDWVNAEDNNSILKKCTFVKINKMAKLWNYFLK